MLMRCFYAFAAVIALLAACAAHADAQTCAGGACKAFAAVPHAVPVPAPAVIYYPAAVPAPSATYAPTATYLQAAPVAYAAVESRPRFPLLSRLFGGLRGTRGGHCGR